VHRRSAPAKFTGAAHQQSAPAQRTIKVHRRSAGVSVLNISFSLRPIRFLHAPAFERARL